MDVVGTMILGVFALGRLAGLMTQSLARAQNSAQNPLAQSLRTLGLRYTLGNNPTRFRVSKDGVSFDARTLPVDRGSTGIRLELRTEVALTRQLSRRQIEQWRRNWAPRTNLQFFPRAGRTLVAVAAFPTGRAEPESVALLVRRAVDDVVCLKQYFSSIVAPSGDSDRFVWDPRQIADDDVVYMLDGRGIERAFEAWGWSLEIPSWAGSGSEDELPSESRPFLGLVKLGDQEVIVCATGRRLEIQNQLSISFGWELKDAKTLEDWLSRAPNGNPVGFLPGEDRFLYAIRPLNFPLGVRLADIRHMILEYVDKASAFERRLPLAEHAAQIDRESLSVALQRNFIRISVLGDSTARD